MNFKVTAIVGSALVIAAICAHEILQRYFQAVPFNASGAGPASVLAAVIGWVTTHALRRIDELLNSDLIPADKLQEAHIRLERMRRTVWALIWLYVFTLACGALVLGLRDSLYARLVDWTAAGFVGGFVLSLLSLFVLAHIHRQASVFTSQLRLLKAAEKSQEKAKERKVQLRAEKITAPPIDHLSSH